MLTMCFAACSDKNEDAGSSNNNPLSGSLVGSWYGEYAAEGETTDGTNSIAGTYIKAVQGLTFNADGTGTCTKFLCNVATEPLSIFGGQMDQSNGRFHYTSNADGTVSITRDGDGNDANPKTWTMKLVDGVLSGTDGGTAFQLKTADEYQKAALTAWEEILRDGDNGDIKNKSFLKDWENCDTVYISGFSEPKYLPWASSGKSDIPEEILLDRKKADGWEMAFCCLSDPKADKTRYFGLYNRISGVLRVYMYIPDASAYGNEMAFNVACGTTGDIRYPFYNAMDYAIPNNMAYRLWNKDIRLVTGTSKYAPLSWCQTPYSDKATADGVSTYWHCFDIDMSGYVPGGTEPWKSHIDRNNELLSFSPISQSTSNIKLTGTLFGDLGGSFENPKMKTAPANADLHRARMAMSFIGSFFGGAGGAITQGAAVYNGFTNNNHFTADEELAGWSVFGCGMIGMACNTIGGLLSSLDQTTTTQVEPGKIDLKLDARIDMTGVMKEWKSVPDGGLRLTPGLLKETNPDSHIGEGCFGLAEAPVVYISKEDLMAEADQVNLVYDGNVYKAGTEEENERYALRFVSFLDPNSIKINLNTNVYHDIKNVTVTVACGVNTSMPTGYTDSYRQLMGLSERPTIELATKAGMVRLNATSNVRLHNIPRDTLLKDEKIAFYNGVKLDSVQLVKQVGDEVYRYYGPRSRALGYNLMLEPQPYLPFSGYDFKKLVAPDVVVAVIVWFECREKKDVLFIKQFIPDFKLVTHKELTQHYNNLKSYYDKSKNEQPVGALANEQSVPVYSNSWIYMGKDLKMLKKITEN